MVQRRELELGTPDILAQYLKYVDIIPKPIFRSSRHPMSNACEPASPSQNAGLLPRLTNEKFKIFDHQILNPPTLNPVTPNSNPSNP